jgi:hypothetical protein
VNRSNALTTCLKGLFACGLLVLSARSSLGQELRTETPPTSGIVVASAEAEAFRPERSPIVGKPYSATTESERFQTLADGTHIDEKMSSTRTYRDSLGRTRLER